MNEYLLEAREELKRLEHIIYVSLKYSRTTDVLINALHRLVSVYDLIIEGYLEEAKEKKLLDALPKSPALRAKRLAEMYENDAELQKYMTFYAFLKTVLKLPHQKRQEYRRHVTLIVELESNATAEIDIDSLINCEKFSHRFFKYAWNNIVGAPEEE